MIGRLRLRHRRTFLLLAVVLPALVALGVAARASASAGAARGAGAGVLGAHEAATAQREWDGEVQVGEAGEGSPWE